MIKTPAEIELMTEAGRLLARVFTHLDGMTLQGLSTLEINDRVEAFIVDELKARPASKASYRSINAQAAFWIRIGMLCETNPGLTFQELVARELKAAGVDAASPPVAAA